MGKRRGKKKKKRVKSEIERCTGHESGPETTTGRERRDSGQEDSCSPAWNSLDEESLADYAENAAAGESGGEVEVAKLLSFLNFSVIPCALEPYNLECELPHAPSGGGPPTDVDLLSELTSATHLEREEDVREGETEDARGKRRSRKRASHRRPNKRAKKLRSSVGPASLAVAAGEFMCLCHFVRAGGEERLEEEKKRTRNGAFAAALPRDTVVSMNSGGYYCERCYGRGGRGKRGRRRSREGRFDPLARAAAVGRWSAGRGRGTRSESSTPVNLPTHSMPQHSLVEMECENGDFSNDTSATGEVDMGAEPDDSDHTPPAESSPGDLYEGEREEEEESELSDTTTDRCALILPEVPLNCCNCLAN